LRGSFPARLTSGLLSLHLFAGFAGASNATRPPSAVTPRGATAARPSSPTYDGLRQDGVFNNLEQALRSPEKVRRLVIQNAAPGTKHLPAALGDLVNLEALEISCLESLEDLPEETGRLRKLEELIIDNGNGCSMNVSLPRSIGRLENLRVLRLYGALDAREIGDEGGARRARSKRLPDTLANLQRLEELDLGRNGIRAVPPQVASLRGLKKLGLDYNDVHEVPAFVGDLTNLRELSLNSNGGVVLPQSLARVKGLKVFMGNNRLTLRDQRALRTRFPNAVFSFENEYDDDAANEEPAKPKSRTPRGRRR
jgi:Leucine-rich repeat (LRR) protein